MCRVVIIYCYEPLRTVTNMTRRVDIFGEMTNYNMPPPAFICYHKPPDFDVIVLKARDKLYYISELFHEQIVYDAYTRPFAVGKCGYCSQRVGYKFNSKSYAKCVYCCSQCFTMQKRMFEFFRSKHPLLTNLSKIDYLSDDKRFDEFVLQCNYHKTQIIRTSLPVGILPTEIRRHINHYRLMLFCKEFDIPVEHFHYFCLDEFRNPDID